MEYSRSCDGPGQNRCRCLVISHRLLHGFPLVVSIATERDHRRECREWTIQALASILWSRSCESLLKAFHNQCFHALDLTPAEIIDKESGRPCDGPGQDRCRCLVVSHHDFP